MLKVHAHESSNYGDLVEFGAKGNTIVAAGEAGDVLRTNNKDAAAPNTEHLYLVADGWITLIANLQNSWKDADKIEFRDKCLFMSGNAIDTGSGKIQAGDITANGKVNAMNGVYVSGSPVYSEKNEPPYPVSSVNGKTGYITLFSTTMGNYLGGPDYVYDNYGLVSGGATYPSTTYIVTKGSTRGVSNSVVGSPINALFGHMIIYGTGTNTSSGGTPAAYIYVENSFKYPLYIRYGISFTGGSSQPSTPSYANSTSTLTIQPGKSGQIASGYQGYAVQRWTLSLYFSCLPGIFPN